MGLIDGAVDFISSPFKIGKNIIGGAKSAVGGIFGGNDDIKKLMNEQMQAYKDQTELTRKELEAKKKETDIQKRRIEEKQIRAIRRNYQAPGLLGTGQPSSQDMNSQLGG